MIGALEQEGKIQMQLVTNSEKSPSMAVASVAEVCAVTESPHSEYRIIRRNGAVVGFDPGKISFAMTKAFPAIERGQGAASSRIREPVAGLTRERGRRRGAAPARRRAQSGLATLMPAAFERRQACVR